MKWKLIDSRLIEGTEGEYTLRVTFDGKIWLWGILKDGKTIDSVFNHPYMPSGEIDARVKAERAYNALILAAAPEVEVVENIDPEICKDASDV